MEVADWGRPHVEMSRRLPSPQPQHQRKPGSMSPEDGDRSTLPSLAGPPTFFRKPYLSSSKSCDSLGSSDSNNADGRGGIGSDSNPRRRRRKKGEERQDISMHRHEGLKHRPWDSSPVQSKGGPLDSSSPLAPGKMGGRDKRLPHLHTRRPHGSVHQVQPATHSQEQQQPLRQANGRRHGRHAANVSPTRHPQRQTMVSVSSSVGLAEDVGSKGFGSGSFVSQLGAEQNAVSAFRRATGTLR